MGAMPYLNPQHSVGRCTHTSPIMKWANTLKESSEEFTEAERSLHNISWYTDTNGFLEHSPSMEILYCKGPILQKIILFRGGLPRIVLFTWKMLGE